MKTQFRILVATSGKAREYRAAARRGVFKPRIVRRAEGFALGVERKSETPSIVIISAYMDSRRDVEAWAKRKGIKGIPVRTFQEG